MASVPPPPLQRTARNLLVTGHRPNRLPADSAAMAAISTALEQTMLAIAGWTRLRFGAGLRIVTGLAEGSDAIAAGIAQRRELPLHVVAPCPRDGAAAALAYAQRATLLAGAPLPHPLPEALVDAADQGKLALADLMIVVWDGEPAQGGAGGSVRLVSQALRHFTPVIWIDASAAAAGRISVLEHTRMDGGAFELLALEPGNAERIRRLFRALPAALTETDFTQLLTPLWDLRTLHARLRHLQRGDVDPRARRTLSGLAHGLLLRPFGGWPRKAWRALAPWRGVPAFLAASRLPDATWDWFDRFERAALHAANRHRDQVVIMHLLASLAVLGAVAGAIDWLGGKAIWAVFELLMLAGIGAILARESHRPLATHLAWIDFRQAAEAIRLSALLQAAAASLAPLYDGTWQYGSGGAPQLLRPGNWLVIQLLREGGAPDSRHCLQDERHSYAAGLEAFIDSQLSYHHGAHDRYHQTHSRLHGLTLTVFGLVLLTVLLHLGELGLMALQAQATVDTSLPRWLASAAHGLHAQRWLLLVTAFFPALAAALHGIMSKLELQRLAKNSQQLNQRLLALKQVLDAARNEPALRQTMLQRSLAIVVANAMYAEHEAWSSLMREQGLTLPA